MKVFVLKEKRPALDQNLEFGADLKSTKAPTNL